MAIGARLPVVEQIRRSAGRLPSAPSAAYQRQPSGPIWMSTGMPRLAPNTVGPDVTAVFVALTLSERNSRLMKSA